MGQTLAQKILSAHAGHNVEFNELVYNGTNQTPTIKSITAKTASITTITVKIVLIISFSYNYLNISSLSQKRI